MKRKEKIIMKQQNDTKISSGILKSLRQEIQNNKAKEKDT